MINIPNNVLDALTAPVRQIEMQISLKIDNEYIDITEDCTQVDITEDTCAYSEENPYGSITYNSLKMELNNLTGKYTLDNVNSEYYGKLISEQEIRIQYKVHYINNSGKEAIYSLSGGTFYVDGWTANVGEISASVTAYDKLRVYGEKTMKYFPVQKDIHSIDAFIYLFKLMGVDDRSYRIENGLTTVFDFFWPEGETYTDCLQAMAIASCCNIYTNRQGVIIVSPLGKAREKVITLKDNDLIINMQAESSYKEAYNNIIYKSAKVKDYTPQELGSVDKVTLLASSTTDVVIENPQKTIVDIAGISVIGCTNVDVSGAEINGNITNIQLRNNTTNKQEANVNVYGTILETDGIENQIATEATMASTDLSLSIPYCVNDGSIINNLNLLKKVYAGRYRRITLDVVALPFLEIGDKIEIYSDISGIHQEYIIQEITFSYNGALNGTMVVSASEEVLKNKYYYVCPGLVVVKKGE